MHRRAGIFLATALFAALPICAFAQMSSSQPSVFADLFGFIESIEADAGDLLASVFGGATPSNLSTSSGQTPVAYTASVAAPSADTLPGATTPATPPLPPTGSATPTVAASAPPIASSQHTVVNQTIVVQPVNDTGTATRLNALVAVVFKIAALLPSLSTPQPETNAAFSQQITGDGNPEAIGAGAAINQLSNTSITTPSILGGSISDTSVSASSLSSSGSAAIGGALSVGDASTTRNNLGLSFASAGSALYAAYNITAWGDSLTAGNEDGTGVTYPNVLSSDLAGRPVSNQGVGGQTSTQIGVRQGGVTTNVTVSGRQIPPSGGVSVTFKTGYEPVTLQGPSGGTPGSISDIAGTVTLSGSTYTFTRTTSGATTTVSGAVPFVVNTGMLNNGTVIIWAGRNNISSPSQVESDIANMITNLGSNQHYLILSVLNGEGEGATTTNYSEIIGINNYLAATYSSHYLDIRSYLVSQYNPSLPQDVSDHSADVPPTSLRYDFVHLNATGYNLVAQQIANFITGTLDTANTSGVIVPSSVPTLFASPYPIGSVAPSTGMFTSVGIGTTTPLETLGVDGSIGITGTNPSLNIRGGNANSQLNIDFPEMSTASAIVRLFRSTNTSGASTGFVIYKGDGSATANTFLSANGSNSYLNAIGGNVSIGTTTPLETLDVGGNIGLTNSTSRSIYVRGGNTATNLNIDFPELSSTTGALRIFRGTNTTANSSNAMSVQIYKGDGSGSIQTLLAADSNSYLNAIGGNVGIGTTSPVTPLEINTSTQASPMTAGTASGGLSLLSLSGLYGMFAGILNSGSAYVQAARDDTATYYNLLLQPSGGDVGIGTTTPLETLGVDGSIGITGTNPSLNIRGGNANSQLNIDFPEMSTASAIVRLFRSTNTSGASTGFVIYKGDGSATANTFLSANGSNSYLNAIGGNVGIGTTTSYGRLEVWGSDTASTTAFLVANSASTTEFTVYDTGNATLAGSLVQNSDQRLKTNIESLDASSSLSLIDELNPVTFNWIDPNKGSTPQLGFIAQQVQQVFPNLVSTTSATALTPNGTLSLNYIDLISPIISAIQALDQEFTSLEATVAGFAESFTTNILNSQQDNTQQLCLTAAGTKTCITQSQLAALLASETQSSPSSSATLPPSPTGDATDSPPVIQINGANPALIRAAATYNDLGATITGPQADLNLGIETYVNGLATSPVQIDTTESATDTIDYVVTDSHGLTSTSTRTVIVKPAILPASSPPASPADASTSATTTTQ